MSSSSQPTTTSAFEILGPIMVGPSSSHTAGALRCAHVAASLLNGNISKVHFTLWNSFARTYKGHGTDRALVAGILGFAPDDSRIRYAFDFAHERGLDFDFKVAGANADLHPNTVDIEMTNASGVHATVRGESLGGGKIRISRINGIAVDISGAYCTLFIAHRDAPGALAALTSLLAEKHINIAFCRTYRTEAGGQAYSVFETDGRLPGNDFLETLRKIALVDYVATIEVPGASAPLLSATDAPEFFTSGKQLLEAAKTLHATIGSVMRQREEHLTTKDATSKNINRVLDVMREETTEPIANPHPSLGGFLGGEAQSIFHEGARFAPALLGTVQTNATAHAMAVLERSASMDVIVAAPTAGSAGVVPGSVLALGEHLGAHSDQLEDALFCAAAVGLLLSSRACVAGAEGGCQAEVGSAAAMSAAALCQMMGGTPGQCLNAASLALANLLGLVCDPVGGLVEVPCQNRNAIGIAAAFSSAQLSLSGIKSLVPFDEMTKVMLEVGHALPATLRETALGGIAIAPSALNACSGCC